MPAIRCKECRFVAAENTGFCPECGAVYVEPFEYVDESFISQKSTKVEKPNKKRIGFLSALFSKDADDWDDPLVETSTEEVIDPGLQTVDLSFEGLKIRCQECRNTVLANDHEGYCPDCGAFFVKPYDYVTEEETKSKRPPTLVMLQADKPFEELSD